MTRGESLDLERGAGGPRIEVPEDQTAVCLTGAEAGAHEPGLDGS